MQHTFRLSPADTDGTVRKSSRATRSCYTCHRRKVRCIYQADDNRRCNECVKRGWQCVSQAEAAESRRDEDAPVSARLKDRVARLESLIRNSSTSIGSNDRTSSDLNPVRSSLENILAGIDQAAYHSTPNTARGSRSEAVESEGPEHVEPSEQAPLMRLLNNPLFGTNLGASPNEGSGESARSSPDPREKRTRRHAFEYTEGIRDLCSALPSAGEMEYIFNNQSSWWRLFSDTLGLQWGDTQTASFKDLVMSGLADGQPAFLGLILVCFAVSTGDTRRYLPPVERQILANDELARSEKGLDCLMGLGLCYLCSLQPRRAWTVFRRAMTLLQLGGIHRMRKRTPRQESAFWQYYHADRWISLMIGLPYMLSDHFCNIEINIAKLPTHLFLYRKLTVITGRVVDSLQAINGPTLSSALRVEEDMEDIVAQLPPRYLEIDDIKTSQTLEEKLTRLYRVIHYRQLKSYVHLPHFVQSASSVRFEYSRKTCIDDARHLLVAFLEVYNVDPQHVADGTVLSFNAFISAVVVLLGLIGYGQFNKSSSHAQPEDEQSDWNIIYSTLDVIKSGAAGTAAPLCRECHTALDSLVKCARGTSLTSDKRVILPYFGAITITRGSHFDASSVQQTPQSTSSNTIQEPKFSHPLSNPGTATGSDYPSGNDKHTQLQTPPDDFDTSLAHDPQLYDISLQCFGPFGQDGFTAGWPGASAMDDPVGVQGSGMDWNAGFGTADWSWLDADLPPALNI